MYTLTGVNIYIYIYIHIYIYICILLLAAGWLLAAWLLATGCMMLTTAHGGHKQAQKHTQYDESSVAWAG